jgi:hypothetical protein
MAGLAVAAAVGAVGGMLVKVANDLFFSDAMPQNKVDEFTLGMDAADMDDAVPVLMQRLSRYIEVDPANCQIVKDKIDSLLKLEKALIGKDNENGKRRVTPELIHNHIAEERESQARYALDCIKHQLPNGETLVTFERLEHSIRELIELHVRNIYTITGSISVPFNRPQPQQ